MDNNQSRRWAFLVSTLWLGFAGITMLFPVLARPVFGLEIVNLGVASEFGGITLILALIAFICSTDPERYGALWLPFALGPGLNAIINLFYLLNGHYTLSNSLFQLVLMPVLAIWFWVSRPRMATSRLNPE